MAKKAKAKEKVKSAAEVKTNSESNHYDKIIKENLVAVTPTLIRSVLHIDAVEMINIPTKLQRTKEREPDFLKIIVDATGRRFILHIEFQLADDGKMIFRKLEYFAMLARIYPTLDIEQYVIFIGDKVPSMETVLQRRNISFQFTLISLLNIDYKIFLTGKAEEAIFAILADYGNENPEIVVNHIIQKIRLFDNFSGNFAKWKKTFMNY
jgi:hypothetical protein